MAMFGITSVSAVKIDVGNLPHHLEQAVGFFELFDLFVELEFLNDLARPRRKPGHVIAQVGGELVGVAEQLLEGEFAGVVEGKAEFLVNDLLDHVIIVLAIGLQLLVVSDDLVFACLQHAIQTAQHGERDHHTTILRWPVWPAQEIGDIPDDVAVLFECVQVFHG
jgi:hypothetical protein